MKIFACRFLLAVAAIAVASCDAAPTYPTADLVISPTGALSLDGRPLAEKDLVQELKEVREREPHTMLNIRIDVIKSDLPPMLAVVNKAAQEAGIASTNLTSYEEQEHARQRKNLRRDLALFGGIVLFAVLASTPFALRAKTPSAAMVRGVVGVLTAGIFAGVLVGLYLGLQDSRGNYALSLRLAVNVLIILVYVAPYSAAAGLLVGALCALRVRFRPLTSPARPVHRPTSSAT